MKKLTMLTAAVALLSLVVLPSVVMAQGPLERLNTVQTTSGLSDAPLEATVGVIINVALSLVGVILVVLIIYGGFLWMTAGGEEKKVTTAKTIITNSIIGLIIVLVAYGIANFVLGALQTAGLLSG